MVKKENTKIVKGDLCYYKKMPVIVLQRILRQFNFSDEQSFLVLFPQGGIDTVNVRSLKLVL